MPIRLSASASFVRVPLTQPSNPKIAIEIGSENVSLTLIFDSDFDPDPDFEPQLS
jgi:hypothetical protein